jgi:hypothetical protein
VRAHRCCLTDLESAKYFLGATLLTRIGESGWDMVEGGCCPLWLLITFKHPLGVRGTDRCCSFHSSGQPRSTYNQPDCRSALSFSFTGMHDSAPSN